MYPSQVSRKTLVPGPFHGIGYPTVWSLSLLGGTQVSGSMSLRGVTPVSGSLSLPGDTPGIGLPGQDWGTPQARTGVPHQVTLRVVCLAWFPAGGLPCVSNRHTRDTTTISPGLHESLAQLINLLRYFNRKLTKRQPWNSLKLICVTEITLRSKYYLWRWWDCPFFRYDWNIPELSSRGLS